MVSKLGGFATILFFISLIAYFTYLVERMYNGQDDNIVTLTKANDLRGSNKEIDIDNSNLLPSM